MDSYSAGLSAAMDRHAPVVTRCVNHRRSAPWLTDEIREGRRGRQQAECRWGSIRLTVHRKIFVKEWATVKRCMRDARKLNSLQQQDTSALPLSSFLLCLTNCSAKQRLPLCHRTFPFQTCHSGFVTQFFVIKIKRIREDLDSCPHDPPSFIEFDGPQLSMFEPVTKKLICRLISVTNEKLYLDPISD